MSTNKINKPKKREVLGGVMISVEQARNLVAVYLTIKTKYYLFYIQSNVFASLLNHIKVEARFCWDVAPRHVITGAGRFEIA
jgi:hypothetical protein